MMTKSKWSIVQSLLIQQEQKKVKHDHRRIPQGALKLLRLPNQRVRVHELQKKGQLSRKTRSRSGQSTLRRHLVPTLSLQ